MSRRLVLAVLLATGPVPLAVGGCGEQKVREAAPARIQREGGDAGKPAGGATPPAPTDRKIIYTATLDVVVDDLTAARAEVDRLLAARKGFVAKSEVRTDPGTRRSATYTLKVPVDGFRPLVDELAALGTPERNAVDSQDVTEEYVDVDARVKNLKEQEAKLNELLKERRKEEKLEDVLRIGDRIGEVRQQVERAEGRLKYLATTAALSTVNLTLREIKDYVSPTAPTFAARVGRTFRESWEGVVSFAEGVALAAVALTPWLPVLVPAGFAGWWLLRRSRWRIVLARPAEAPAPPAAGGPNSPPG
jgi:hypothetical protein